jgi:hypothetical protein
MPARRSTIAAVVLAGLLLALTGCTGEEPEEPAAPPTEQETPLPAIDTRKVAVVRGAFCHRVSGSAVEAAVGGEVAATSTYDNGEPVTLADGSRDVAHEFGCEYRAEDRSTARAWVFAPPVTPDRADELVAAADAGKGCRADGSAPAFGQPSVALVCTRGDVVESSYRGLFGDAWLTCTLEVAAGSVDDQELLARTGHWCVATLEAARA